MHLCMQKKESKNIDKNKITIVDNKKLKYVIEPADVHRTSHCVCICFDV